MCVTVYQLAEVGRTYIQDDQLQPSLSPRARRQRTRPRQRQRHRQTGRGADSSDRHPVCLPQGVLISPFPHLPTCVSHHPTRDCYCFRIPQKRGMAFNRRRMKRKHRKGAGVASRGATLGSSVSFRPAPRHDDGIMRDHRLSDGTRALMFALAS